MSTDKPQLYIHIGHPKTASSTIQAFLYNNWQLIERAGYMQPTAQLTVADKNTPPSNPLWTLQEIKAKQSGNKIAQWIEAANIAPSYTGKLLLSSESLAQPEWPALFAPIGDIADIHLIYYVRRQDMLLLSAWRQWGVKRGLTLDAFIKRRCKNVQPNFNEIVEGWKSNVAIASTHIRFLGAPFTHEDGVIADLAMFLNMDISGFSIPSDQNISVDVRLLAFFAHHPTFFSSVHDETIFELLRDNTDQPEMRAMLSQEQFTLIRDAFEPLNQKLLSDHNPENSGKTVLESRSAPISLLPMPDIADQHKYISSRLSAAANSDHPLLNKLSHLLDTCNSP